jgi:hypothetical protein
MRAMIISTTAVLGGLSASLSAPLGPISAAAAPAPCDRTVPTDLDGGGADVVVGLPSYDLPGKPDAGAIVIFSDVAASGDADPARPAGRRLFTADDFAGASAQAGARFGASLAAVAHPFDDPDRCSDLLVGAPGLNVSGRAGAGQVYRVRGAAGGPTDVTEVWNESVLPAAGGAQAGAHFGAAVAALSSSTIAIGAPGRDIAGAGDAGRVIRLDYLSDPEPEQAIVQQGGGGAGRPEPGDRFGRVLDLMPTFAGTLLVVGVPDEDIGSRADAGAVALHPLHGVLSMVSQDSPGSGGTAESGDRYGSALDLYAAFDGHPVAMAAIGVPGEDVAGHRNAGLVSFAGVVLDEEQDPPVRPIQGRGPTLTQDSPGVPGAVEQGDRFGAALLTDEFGSDAGRLHLVVGSPREDLGRTVDAGMVTMTTMERRGIPAAGPRYRAWTQDSPGVSGTAEAGDRFGAALSSVQLTTLEDDDDVIWSVVLATVPGEDLASRNGAGMAELGIPPGIRSVGLVPPRIQAGAGSGMSPMRQGS